jgi:signal transduction histidine kinase
MVVYALANVEWGKAGVALVLLPVAVIAGRVSFPMPRGGELMGHTLVYLPAVLLLPAPDVILLASGGTLISQLWTHKPWFKVAFNTSQSTVSRGAASFVWFGLSGGQVADPRGLLEHLPAVTLTSAVYFVVNGVLISSVIALHKGGRPWETWRADRASVLLPQVGMYSMAVLVAGAWLYDPRAILLMVVPAAVTWSSFRQVRALEEKTVSEQALREKSEQLAARWETLASVSAQLGECVGPDAVLRTAAGLVVAHCADAARVRAGGRSAASQRDEALAGLLDEPGAQGVRRLALRVGGNEVGLLEAAWVAGAPNAEEEALLDQLADRIAVELENALLLEQGAEVEAVREVARMKDEFLSQVSHELRSPLALLIGYGELLKERPPAEDEVRWMGERIHRSGEHLARLVDDLLEAGRLESGRFSLDRRRLDPVGEAATAVENAAASHPTHRFVLRGGEGAPAVLADATRLQQVLSNLLSNAARYAPAGTQVTVALEPDVGAMVIAVEDEGPGVPPDERARVFEKFYRTAEAKQQVKKGLGLGLAICRDLVVAHGGRIWVEDAPGGGARFGFTLPVAEA